MAGIIRGYVQRGGNGRNGDGTWPPTDGSGCPRCGAVRGGDHGGGCPNQAYAYDEDGSCLGRSCTWDKPAYALELLEADLDDMRKP